MTQPRLVVDEQLCFALYSATNAITRSYRSRLKRLGLTYPQYLVMMVLWQHDSCTVGEIADRLNLASHAITPIITRLLDAGMIEREGDARDRRVVHIRATAQGRLIEQAACLAQHAVGLDTGLDETAIALLREALAVLTSNLNDASETDANQDGAAARPSVGDASRR